jgi:protein translocase SecG subunit
MNDQILLIAQMVISALLIGLILLQSKGTGLGSTFGGETGFYRTKRGAEKIVFYLTIALTFLFLVISALRIVL